MLKNKEFEEWQKWFDKQKIVYGRSINTINSINGRTVTDSDISEISYIAALQSERDKHRWIPVTERYPSEHDGKQEYKLLFSASEAIQFSGAHI